MAEERSEAAAYVIAQLKTMIGGDSPYRVGVLMLTHAPTDGQSDCRIAQGVMLNGSHEAAAVDTVILIRALRDLAFSLEKTVRGETPLPSQEGL